MLKKTGILLLVIACFVNTGTAQLAKVDSLLNVLRSAKKDTGMVGLLNQLSLEVRNGGNYAASKVYANKALSVAGELNFKKGEADALVNLGSVYYEQSDYAAALGYFLKALTINEELRDPERLTGNYLYIGNIYSYTDTAKAGRYYREGLKTARQAGDDHKIADALVNMGTMFYASADLTRALDLYSRALEIAKRTNSTGQVQAILNNTAAIYTEQKAYAKAMDNYRQELELAERSGIKANVALALGNIGSLYAIEGDFKNAGDFLQRALVLSREIGNYDLIKDHEKTLSELYSDKGNYPLALAHYKNYIAARDSVFNEAATKKQTQVEMQYEFGKQQTADSIKNAEALKQETLRHEQEISQQRIYTAGGIIGFVLMLIVAGVSFNAYRQKQKANDIISAQKRLVEEKQKEILDSIHYARRIQKALLASEGYIDRSLKRFLKE